jgi:hypothetical protein
MTLRKGLAWLLAAALLGGCAVVAQRTLDALDATYGRADPGRTVPQALPGVPDFQREVKPVLEQRCVVCHGCYDSPCQLNLASHEGLRRGASQAVVYDTTRLRAAAPTRIHIDAQTPAQWRGLGFAPVLNERDPTPEANREAGVMYRMLRLKRTHPPPSQGVLDGRDLDFSLDRKQVCPAAQDMPALEREHPQWGMPFGLPALPDAEYATLARWIEGGAPYRPGPGVDAAHRTRVQQWEAFLNGDELKTQLMARYVYEHWFLAHLYFSDLPTGEFFEIVRSATPPGQPIQLIATRRPYDDPGVARVYYRLRQHADTLLAKTHMPYALNARRMQRLRALFLGKDYEVEVLPSYAPEVASNPFAAFQALPVGARYRFMLDEAQFTVMNFIKGPVCRGQVALNVINDHAWVFFVDPALASGDHLADFLVRELPHLRLPAEEGSTALPLSSWARYAALQEHYLRAKARFDQQRLAGAGGPTLDQVWAGDGANPNAALTLLRHDDSASVLKGLLGSAPQTVWLIGYPLLERMHYLLAAGYDVFGNVGHQLVTRLYMDFLRMEAQMNYLALLPQEARVALRAHWYRGAGDEVLAHMSGARLGYTVASGVAYQTSEPHAELLQMLAQRMAPVLERRHALVATDLPARQRQPLQRLAALSGAALAAMPEVALLAVQGGDGSTRHYTLLHHRAFSNITHLYGEDRRRLPAEDTLMVARGFVGAHPNAFYAVPEAELGAFVDAVQALHGEADYRQRIMQRWAIRRTDARFWPHSDALHAAQRAQDAVEAALFDYNRFENR